MPIVRITKKQLEAAAKARELTLKKDRGFGVFVEHRERLEQEAMEASKGEQSP
jgi:hypothetical protein